MITYPLNNIDYTAEDAELYFSTRESGVYDGNDFEVTVSGIDNNVTVDTGIAWIHNTKFSGKVVALKEPKTLTLSLPNSVYDRIDAIVIQFDANKNATEIVVKEGIASSAPIAPNVVRTESLYELHIFHVQRKAGATVISVEDLVDLRNNSDYCGIMFDPISSIDSTLTKSSYAADAKATGDGIKAAKTAAERALTEITPIERGGTGASTATDALNSLMARGSFSGNLNDVKSVGVYWLNLNECQNAPTNTGYGFLEVIQYSPASVVTGQRFVLYNTGEMYVRTYVNNQWYSWAKVNESVDYITAQGTSNGWTYRKWNSGIAECWKEINYNVTLTKGTYATCNVNQTYPFPFAAIPVCNVTLRQNTGHNHNLADFNSNSSQFTRIIVISHSGTGESSGMADVYAVGKWK